MNCPGCHGPLVEISRSTLVVMQCQICTRLEHVALCSVPEYTFRRAEFKELVESAGRSAVIPETAEFGFLGAMPVKYSLGLAMKQTGMCESDDEYRKRLITEWKRTRPKNTLSPYAVLRTAKGRDLDKEGTFLSMPRTSSRIETDDELRKRGIAAFYANGGSVLNSQGPLATDTGKKLDEAVSQYGLKRLVFNT